MARLGVFIPTMNTLWDAFVLMCSCSLILDFCPGVPLLTACLCSRRHSAAMRKDSSAHLLVYRSGGVITELLEHIGNEALLQMRVKAAEERDV